MANPNPQPPSSLAAARSGRGQRVPALTIVPVLPAPADDSPRPEDAWGPLLCAVGEHQDRAAFARLFAHFAPRIKHHLIQTGSPEVQAEELAQEALVAVWRKAALFNPAQAAASTWIFTIARNLRVDLLRRRQGMDATEQSVEFDLLESDEPALDERLHASRQGERLRSALAQLPPEQRQVLHLSYFDDEPHSRIATELGIPLGTVKSRVRLAVAQLRRLLER